MNAKDQHHVLRGCPEDLREVVLVLVLTIFSMPTFVMGVSFSTCATGVAFFLIRRPLCELLIESEASEVLPFPGLGSWHLHLISCAACLQSSGSAYGALRFLGNVSNRGALGK